METLDNTNITELYGSNATFRNFLFGPDMVEACLAGDIDGATLGTVPVIILLAMSDDWTVACNTLKF